MTTLAAKLRAWAIGFIDRTPTHVLEAELRDPTLYEDERANLLREIRGRKVISIEERRLERVRERRDERRRDLGFSAEADDFDPRRT